MDEMIKKLVSRVMEHDDEFRGVAKYVTEQDTHIRELERFVRKQQKFNRKVALFAMIGAGYVALIEYKKNKQVVNDQEYKEYTEGE